MKNVFAKNVLQNDGRGAPSLTHIAALTGVKVGVCVVHPHAGGLPPAPPVFYSIENRYISSTVIFTGINRMSPPHIFRMR
jgi:hypothetical protein